MRISKFKPKSKKRALMVIAILVMMIAFSSFTVASASAEGVDSVAEAKGFILGMSALAAAIATLSGLGSGLGQGMAASKVAESIARQPDARGSILSSTLLTCAVAETCSIYGFVVALILLLANPLVNML